MSKSNAPSPPPSGDGRNLVSTAKSADAFDLEEVVRQSWEKYRFLLVGLAVVILSVIVVRNGMAFLRASQIESARESYAAAGTDAERAAFAADHSGTGLAGLALLKMADAAFAEGRHAQAIAGYDAAIAELADTVFADRLQLGKVVATLLSGDGEAGQTGLRDLANDTDVLAVVRGEAIYHLASLAFAAGDGVELEALGTQIDAVSPGSIWSQRVRLLGSTLPAPVVEAEMPQDITFEIP